MTKVYERFDEIHYVKTYTEQLFFHDICPELASFLVSKDPSLISDYNSRDVADADYREFAKHWGQMIKSDYEPAYYIMPYDHHFDEKHLGYPDKNVADEMYDLADLGEKRGLTYAASICHSLALSLYNPYCSCYTWVGQGHH